VARPLLPRLRAIAERAGTFARALRSTGVVQPVRPSQLVHFARGARLTPIGPHMALMFHAAAHPDREALVEYRADGSVRRLSWAELDATINRLAHALVDRGVGRHTSNRHVAVMLPNGGDYIIVQQALARIGGTAVQIGYRSKPAEIAYILDNAAPVVTVVHAEFVAAMRDARARTGKGGAVIVVGGDAAPGNGDADAWAEWDRALAAASPELPPRVVGGDGGGVIVYTSGTTGKPKGASRAWKRTGFDSVADMIVQMGIRADERHLCVCPLYHSAAPAFVAIMQSLGAAVVVMDHFEPEGALAIIERERITSTLMVPTMIVRTTNLPEDVRYDTSSLRWVMSAAAPLSTEAARRFMARFGPVLWNFYGSTETGLVTLAGPLDHLARPGTIGRALRGNRIRLLDDAGHEVPTGVIGELYARNSTMITGYHGNAEATADSQRDGFFSVGDMGRVDADGYYFLESRKHDMVISGGVNIYPREIEDCMMAHPAVLEAAVVGVPDAEWGESLRAFVVLRAGQRATESELIDHVKAGLADFKKPRAITFIAELPRNPTGKVLKRELRAMVTAESR
jgi:fatty-acyl-CoA synthase